MSQQLDQRVPSNLTVPDSADISFDDLFPPEGFATPTTAQSEQTANPEPQPQAVETPEEFFLKAPNGTVYKTSEDAIRGTVEKDTTIERLRAQLSEATGVDPLTGKPVGAKRTPPQATDTVVPNYAQDPEAFWNATADAVEKKDPKAWQRAQQKFLQDQLAPIAPILQGVAMRNALDQASTELPGFRELKSSPEFKQMLDTMPMIRDAITQGETYLEAAPQLPELYRYAYLMYQGTKAQEIVRTGVSLTPVPTQPTRPTLTSSTMTPPEPGPAPNMATPEGRKAIIAQYESKGGDRMNWRDRGI